MFVLFAFLLILATQAQSAFVEYQCVRITNTYEDYIFDSWILQVDFEPISCPRGVKMDPRTTLTVAKSEEMDKLVYREDKQHMDKRYLEVGTELLIVTNHITKRLEPVSFGITIGLGVSAVIGAIAGIILIDKQPVVPRWIKPKEDVNSNYHEQLRLQEIKDAEAKLRNAMKKAKSLDPTQVAPAKKSGKRGEWCTVASSKVISLGNNNAPGGIAAPVPGPSGNGPTPPPTPSWSKGTPAPKVVTEEPKKRKSNEPFLQRPKIIRLSDSPVRILADAVGNAQNELEVVNISDDSDDADVIANEGQGEIFVNLRPGNALATTSRICEDLHSVGNSRTDHFQETDVVLISSGSTTPISHGTINIASSSRGTIDLIFSPTHSIISSSASPNTRGAEGVEAYNTVLNRLPAIRNYINPHPNPGLNSDLLPETPDRTGNPWPDLGWGSTVQRVGNTCVIDSFLSHIIYIYNRIPDYFNRVLRLLNSPSEMAVRNVLRVSRNTAFTHQRRDDQIHLQWVSSFEDIFTDTRIDSYGVPYYNIAGSEHNSIVRPLINSTRIWISHVCFCDGLESQMQPAITRPWIFPTTWSAETIGWFRTAVIEQPRVSPSITTLENLECRSCNSNYRATRGYVSVSTWFHQFYLKEDTQEPSVFDFDSYPRTLEFEELETGNIVHFDIAYFSIAIQQNYNWATRRIEPVLGHQTSIHWIEGEGWRYYDGMRTINYLSYVPQNLHATHLVSAVTYFRRIEHFDH